MTSAVRQIVRIISQYQSWPRVIELGARQIPWMETWRDLRPLFPQSTYIGYDLTRGVGVDITADPAHTPEESKTASLVLACEIMEHYPMPWRIAQEVERILEPGGLFVTTIPFVHPIHHMPDYWRITPQGMELLLGVIGNAAVYFQGDLALPRAVYGFASADGDEFKKFIAYFEEHIGEVPGKHVGELFYKWTGEKEYAVARRDNPRREQELSDQYGGYGG